MADERISMLERQLRAEPDNLELVEALVSEYRRSGRETPYEFRVKLARLFTELPTNAQGMAEFRHKTTGMVFVLIPAGEFLMGSPEGQGDDDEHPQHKRVFAEPFLMAKYPWTGREWHRVTGEFPSHFPTAQMFADRQTDLDLPPTPEARLNLADSDGRTWGEHPVESVSWDRCREVEDWINRIDFARCFDAPFKPNNDAEGPWRSWTELEWGSDELGLEACPTRSDGEPDVSGLGKLAFPDDVESAYQAWLWNEHGERVGFQLPTEAMWEYATRAGTTTLYPSGDTEEDLERIAWFGGDWEDGHKAVGLKEPNNWGLHDNCGNVFEWTRCMWRNDYQDAPENGFLAAGETCADPTSWLSVHTIESLVSVARRGVFVSRAPTSSDQGSSPASPQGQGVTSPTTEEHAQPGGPEAASEGEQRADPSVRLNVSTAAAVGTAPLRVADRPTASGSSQAAATTTSASDFAGEGRERPFVSGSDRTRSGPPSDGSTPELSAERPGMGSSSEDGDPVLPTRRITTSEQDGQLSASGEGENRSDPPARPFASSAAAVGATPRPTAARPSASCSSRTYAAGSWASALPGESSADPFSSTEEGQPGSAVAQANAGSLNLSSEDVGSEPDQRGGEGDFPFGEAVPGGATESSQPSTTGIVGTGETSSTPRDHGQGGEDADGSDPTYPSLSSTAAPGFPTESLSSGAGSGEIVTTPTSRHDPVGERGDDPFVRSTISSSGSSTEGVSGEVGTGNVPLRTAPSGLSSDYPEDSETSTMRTAESERAGEEGGADPFERTGGEATRRPGAPTVDPRSGSGRLSQDRSGEPQTIESTSTEADATQRSDSGAPGVRGDFGSDPTSPPSRGVGSQLGVGGSGQVEAESQRSPRAGFPGTGNEGRGGDADRSDPTSIPSAMGGTYPSSAEGQPPGSSTPTSTAPTASPSGLTGAPSTSVPVPAGEVDSPDPTSLPHQSGEARGIGESHPASQVGVGTADPTTSRTLTEPDHSSETTEDSAGAGGPADPFPQGRGLPGEGPGASPRTSSSDTDTESSNSPGRRPPTEEASDQAGEQGEGSDPTQPSRGVGARSLRGSETNGPDGSQPSSSRTRLITSSGGGGSSQIRASATSSCSGSSEGSPSTGPITATPRSPDEERPGTSPGPPAARSTTTPGIEPTAGQAPPTSQTQEVVQPGERGDLPFSPTRSQHSLRLSTRPRSGTPTTGFTAQDQSPLEGSPVSLGSPSTAGSSRESTPGLTLGDSGTTTTPTIQSPTEEQEPRGERGDRPFVLGSDEIRSSTAGSTPGTSCSESSSGLSGTSTRFETDDESSGVEGAKTTSPSGQPAGTTVVAAGGTTSGPSEDLGESVDPLRDRIEGNPDLPPFPLEVSPVVAPRRMLRANWSTEAAQDLRDLWGTDLAVDVVERLVRNNAVIRGEMWRSAWFPLNPMARRHAWRDRPSEGQGQRAAWRAA